MPRLLSVLLLSAISFCPPTVFAGGTGAESNGLWYLRAELGAYRPHLPAYITIDNGSNFPQPLNQDRYSLSEHNKAMAGLALGYRWTKERPWLTQWALGLRYQHFFHQNTGQKIRQYFLPAFENYDYQWRLLSDVLSVSGKANLFQKGRFSPYLQAGLGLAVNQSKTYRETALSGVTPRISPAFSDQISDQFTYHLGAGLDYAFTPKLAMSLGYEFQDLGQMRSNTAIGLWAGQFLKIKHYQTQSVVAGLTYSFA